MIDFQNCAYSNLSPTADSLFEALVNPILVNGEEILCTYKTIRDGVIFTNKRIIAINIQGITGKKKDITSLPYSKVQSFSVETAGTFDLDAEVDIWFSSLGKVRFKFSKGTNITEICKILSNYIL